ncbi:MAG: efflux RND transporter permease subunit [Victivallales bacterium]|jgi:hydrophobic/amphiphilic exporter-1 (mainly G- bacteria), HAE1 family|nr:efflux RND transporter permease subunit [Victivallales bacterium]
MIVTRYSVQRRLATSAIVLALVVLGLYGLRRLPVDFLPDITYPLVKLQIRWPGATPDEIDKDIADPLERLMATVDNLDSLESSAREGVYSLDVHFAYGTNVDVAFQDVLAALTRAEQDLPEDIEPPFVFKADPSQLPVMQLAVNSPRWGPVELREWADNWLQERLLAVPGVAGAEIVGGLEREIRVQLDPVALEKHRLSLDAVLNRLRSGNIERTAGRVTVGRLEIIARTTGEFESLEDIRSVLIARRGPHKVYLRDIAQVEDTHEEERVITRFNGEDCVKISVLKEAEANTVEVAEAVAARLAELRTSFPDGVSLAAIENQAEYVRQSLNGVRNAAIGAAVLLVIVVYLFLGSLRQVLVMAIGLPLTLIINFGLMKLAGFSLNVFSLGGLVIAIGVVLDNSTVVIENISRLHHDDPEGQVGPQAIRATGEVGPAIVAATLSFLALFVPFLIVPGLTSLLFRELILVVASIVVISLTVAVTVVPMLSATLFGRRRPARVATKFGRVSEHLTAAYGWLLRVTLRWRWLVILVFAAVLIGGALLLGRVGGEFLPLMDDGRLMVKVRLPTGTAVRETDLALRRIERQVSEDPLVGSVFALAGGQVRGLTTYEIANEGELNIQLVPKAERAVSTADYVQSLRRKVAQIPLPGVRAMARQNPIKGIHGMRASDIVVQIRGQDTDTLGGLAQSAAETMRRNGNITNVNISMDLSRPEYQVRVDRTKAAELGIDVADVANALRTLVTGTVSTRYRDGNEYIDIRTLVPEGEINSRRDIENLPLTRLGGQTLRVRDVAEVRSGVGPVEIIREDQVRQVSIEADLADGDLAAGVAQVRNLLADLDYPPGYELTFGGRAEMMADMKTTVFSVFGFALFFSFIILAVQFNSLKLPTLILGSVPVCMAGVVYALYLTGFPLGATVIIGVLVVVAATVNDGVLLLTFAGELEERDQVPAFDTVVHAAKIRLRPRIMTTLTTVMGILPLALNLGEGGDMLQPMAVGAIGGLLLEMPVALFLMPCMYLLAGRSSDGGDACPK